MKTFKIVLPALALLLGTTAMVQAQPQPDFKAMDAQAREHGDRMFKKADANGDGFVTKEEMNASAQAAVQERTDRMFADADTNRDGKLSREELDAGREKMRAKMAERFKAMQQQSGK